MTWTELIYGLIMQPVPTFRYIADNKPLSGGLLVFIITTIFNILLNQGLDKFSKDSFATLPGDYIGVYLILGTLSALFFLIVTAAMYNLLGDIFFSRENGKGVFTCMGFAALPGILGPPLQYAFTILNLRGIGVVVLAITAIWVIVLQVIALREALTLETGQAVMIYLLPWVILLIFIISLILMGVLMIPGLI